MKSVSKIWWMMIWVSVALWGGLSCQGQSRESTQNQKEGNAMGFQLSSPAFKAGGEIPIRYTCEGPDVSPPLKWANVPQGTQSLVLICDDPDAPVGTWVHWVLYNIPADLQELPEDVPKEKVVFGQIKQGMNDFRRIGYGGPCPPAGKPHRYFFKLYALDIPSDWESGLTKSDVLKRMEGHILRQTELVGIYQR